MRLLITGANGHLGIRLIRRINETRPSDEVVAIVRSEKAAASLRQEALGADIRVVSCSSFKVKSHSYFTSDIPTATLLHKCN